MCDKWVSHKKCFGRGLVHQLSRVLGHLSNLYFGSSDGLSNAEIPAAHLKVRSYSRVGEAFGVSGSDSSVGQLRLLVAPPTKPRVRDQLIFFGSAGEPQVVAHNGGTGYLSTFMRDLLILSCTLLVQPKCVAENRKRSSAQLLRLPAEADSANTRSTPCTPGWMSAAYPSPPLQVATAP
jgi:hypothetical protein